MTYVLVGVNESQTGLTARSLGNVNHIQYYQLSGFLISIVVKLWSKTRGIQTSRTGVSGPFFAGNHKRLFRPIHSAQTP